MFDGRDDDIEVLEDHAHHYRIPFARTKEHQDNFVSKVLKASARGWFEGMTTLPPEKVDEYTGTNLGAAPEDTTEAIARNLGHLAGFVGYLPGARVLRKLGAVKLAGAVAGMKGKSAPMWVANKAQARVAKAVDPYLKDLPEWAKTGVLSDMAQGAFHLGVASTASAWTHGVDEMFHAAGFGAGAGAVFRGIGNMKGFGERLGANQLKPNGSPNLKKLSEGQRADLALRTMAGSAFQGLPSTLQGATTEEQVYAYAMGAFFGFKEMPYQTRTSREFLHKSIQGDHGPDPEMNPRWDRMTKEMQGIIKNDFRTFFGPEESQYVVYDLLKGKGISYEDIEALSREYREGMEVDPTTGEMYNRSITKKEIEQYKETFKDDPRFDDPQDLDMHIQNILEIPGRLVGKGGYIDKVYPDLNNVERIQRAEEIHKQWSKLHNADTQKPEPGAEQKIIDHIEKTYGKTLSEDDKGWWRRWAENTRKKQWVEQIEMVDGEVGILKGKTNSVGNKKDLSQERLLIEEIYGVEHAKHMKGVLPEEPFFRVLDHQIWGGKEFDLIRARDNLARLELAKMHGKEEFAEMKPFEKRNHAKGVAQKKVNDAYKKLYEAMWRDGYYYYGGKGDSKKMYFVKKHPVIQANPKQANQVRKVLQQVMRNRGVKGSRQSYQEGLKLWKEKYPDIENINNMYEQWYASNVLYELSNNGYALEKPLKTREGRAELETKLTEVLKKGYINDPKAFNKRAQIWFNSGLSANPDYVFTYLRGRGVTDYKGSSFRVGLFKDADAFFSQKDIKLTDEALKYAEISDGAIVARREVVDALNSDKGLPTSGKMNKSFIVSPNPELGSLLGKYAIHIASEPMQKFMEANEIHMMIPESAAKQIGKRKVGELFNNKNGEIEFKGEMYDVPVRDFRTVMSEITSEKYLKKQALPKQMYSVLSAYGHKDIDPKVIADMYETLSNRAIVGSKEGIEILDKYMADPSRANVERVVNNIEEMPINRLFDLIRHPEHPELSQKLYEKILKLNTEYIAGLAEEGEVSRDQFEQYKAGVADFESVVERLAKVFPDGSIGAYLHKFSRDYRMQAMRNYVVQKLTKPKMDNSAAARMRPFEVGMQNHPELGRLNKEQDIFFLDNGFKELVIKDDLFPSGRTTLGELWAEYQKGTSGLYKNNLDKVEQILHGAVMRVPMDSISGAHSLRFQGFTEIDGMGILLHPRSMKALGGADLDGDKAFIFFGGESHGFKQKWREMYHGSKDEYVDKAKNMEKHNKNEIDPANGMEYGAQLAVRDKVLQDKYYHPMAQYAPYWRNFMSEGASGGRDNLGVAVINRMAILGAYNAVRGHDGKSWDMDTITLKERDGFTDALGKDGKPMTGQVIISKDKYSVPFLHNGKKMRIVFTAKKTDQDLQRFREMARASIALGSDPMDEAGLRGELFEGKVLDTLFKYEVHNVDGRGKLKFNQYMTNRVNQGKMEWLKKKGLHTNYKQLNSLLYGRNHQDNRRWSYSEIRAGINKFGFMPESSMNTFLPQLANSMRKINWSDNLFRRVNEPMLNQIYFDHAEMVKEYDWLKDVMGRDTISTTKGRFMQGIFDRRLYTDAGIEKLASSEQEWLKFVDATYTDRVTGEQKPVMGNIPRQFLPRRIGDYNYRRAFLEHLVLKGEDFLVNDLSDMAALKSITDSIKKHGILPEKISEIHQEVDRIKLMGVWAAKRRKALDDILSKDYKDRESIKAVKEARKAFGLDDKGSSKVDQIQIDKEIRLVKEPLSTGERELFDMLYMGTYSKGDRERLKALDKMRKTKKLWGEVSFLEKMLKNTSLVRAGISSREISDASLKKFFKNYDDVLQRSNVDLNEKQKEFLIREAEEKRPIESFRDEEGNLVKGEFIDAGQLSEADRFFLDNIAPFEGILRGKVKDPELKEVYYSLKDHLDHYHNLDVRNLNGLFRGLFKKDINQANKYELQTLDRYFKEMRDGTWFNQMMDWFTGVSKDAPDIKRSNYWKFPKAIERDLLRSPAMMEWKRDIGPYTDKLGNTIENARTVRPMSVVGEVQQTSAKVQEMAMQMSENEINKFRDELRPYVSALSDGDILFNIAVAKRELGYMKAKLREKYKIYGHKLSHQEMEYQNNWDRLKADYEKLRNKTYVVPTEKGRIQMTGEAVINDINNIITQQNVRVRQWMTGNKEKVQKWLDMSEKDGNITWKGLDKLRNEFYKYVTDNIRRNKTIPIEELGIDGMRQIIKRILISQTPLKLRTAKRLNQARKDVEITPFDQTGDLGAEFYFPHLAMDRKVADNRLRSAMKNILNDPNLTPEEKTADIKKLAHQYKALTGDYISKDEMGDNFDIMQEVMAEAGAKRYQKAENILGNDLKKVGNQFSRDAHIGGWDLSPEAYEGYMKNVVNTFYKQTMQVSARTAMHNFNKVFYKQTGDSDLTSRWMNFFKLYTQSAMGYPTHIPERIMNDPQMKIKGTAYKWLADSTAKKRIDYIRKRLGVGRKELEKWNLDEATIDELSGIEYTQLQGWGALEAKWQLASLLAHPKSSIANLYGGTVHTWISAGYDNLKKARDFEYLKTHINPKWKSMKDVERWMQELGVIEEFLVYEAGLNPQLKSKRRQAFIQEAVGKIRRDPNLSDKSLWESAKKHGLTKSVFDKAASFMRVPERILRRDSFMAHYIQAKEKFGGAIKDFNSPFLVNFAKRGVKGTQFLYSAPYRPMWTNSTLGRVMSRFQLWSWNSVRFRNDVIRRAHIAGFQEGTPEFETFKRMAIADAFMIAMSNLFMYSLFENALPAPYNWFQDTADWLMGDEKERERAFYGSPIGPAQAITPPALRLLPPIFKGLMTDDFSQLTDYYLWTIPPFGRLIRDVVGPGGAIENPYYAITKFTGLPVLQIASKIKEEKTPRIGGRFLYG